MTDALTPEQSDHFELRMLDPKRVRVFRHAGVTRLTLENDRSWIKIAVARAFPLSDPDHYVGFLDGAGKDVGMVYDPSQLDSDSRRLVEEELERRYFSRPTEPKDTMTAIMSAWATRMYAMASVRLRPNGVSALMAAN